MKRWAKVGAIVTGGSVAGAAAAVAAGTMVWNRATTRAVGRLDGVSGGHQLTKRARA